MRHNLKVKVVHIGNGKLILCGTFGVQNCAPPTNVCGPVRPNTSVTLLSGLLNAPLHPAPQIRWVSRWHCALYKFTYLLTYLLTCIGPALPILHLSPVDVIVCPPST